MNAYRRTVPPLPEYMRDLPTDPRGFVVPWFTPWDATEGRWRFDAADTPKINRAVRGKLCWICGKGLWRNLAFVIGPMCAINRVTSEPPSHCECADYAVRVCPFLTRPRMRRSPAAEDAVKPGGIMLERNPGVSLLWVTRRFDIMPRERLFRVGEPVRVEAWAEGRMATAAETIESIRTGLPALMALDKDDPEAMVEIRRRLNDAWRVLGLPGRGDGLLDSLELQRASTGLPEAPGAGPLTG
jgi:hypothetical protein